MTGIETDTHTDKQYNIRGSSSLVDWDRDRQTQINNITYVVLAPWLTGIETDTHTDTDKQYNIRGSSSLVDWDRDRQTQINNITYVVLAP